MRHLSSLSSGVHKLQCRALSRSELSDRIGKYHLQSAPPMPLDPIVEIVTGPTFMIAVLQLGDSATDEGTIAQKAEELGKALGDDNISYNVTAPFIANYNLSSTSQKRLPPHHRLQFFNQICKGSCLPAVLFLGSDRLQDFQLEGLTQGLQTC